MIAMCCSAIKYRVVIFNIFTTIWVLFCCKLSATSGQRRIPVLFSNESYPHLSVENKTQIGEQICTCIPGQNVSAWSSWTACSGQVHQDFFKCHDGLKFRHRPCPAFFTLETCIVREWRHCYHEKSCNGHWVEWIDKNENLTDTTECSRSCGGGLKPRIKMCMVDNKVGLFCAGDLRKPYAVNYEICNNFTCPITPKRIASGPFELNILSWILFAVAGILLILCCVLSLVLACTCARKRKPKKARLTIAQPPINADVPISPQYNHLHHNQREFDLGDANNSLSMIHPRAESTPSHGSYPTSSLQKHQTPSSRRDYSAMTSLPRHKPHSSTSTATRHSAQNAKQHGTPRRLIPNPPPVLNHSFSDLQNDVGVTSEFITVTPSIEAATYQEEDTTGYLQSIPRTTKRMFQNSDTTISRELHGAMALQSTEATSNMEDFQLDNPSHMYAEIPH